MLDHKELSSLGKYVLSHTNSIEVGFG